MAYVRPTAGVGTRLVRRERATLSIDSLKSVHVEIIFVLETMRTHDSEGGAELYRDNVKLMKYAM